MPLTLANIGVAAALLACTASTVFGTVSENDVRRLIGTVPAGAYTQPLPGMMFEVIPGTDAATPICRYANAAANLRQPEELTQLYYNTLGRSFPVPMLLGKVVNTEGWQLQVEVKWNTSAEGLAPGLLPELAEACENAAQHAYRRGSVVCVVQDVIRAPETGRIVAVRFNPYAFTPSNATTYPQCPLKLYEDVFWPIRRSFISASALLQG